MLPRYMWNLLVGTVLLLSMCGTVLYVVAERAVNNLRPISGTAYVIDGDTITIGRAHIRLYGIDAPELAQPCMGTWQKYTITWPCGVRAKTALEGLVAGKALVCMPDRQHPKDTYGRTVALCVTPNGDDVGRWLVTHGWAVAYVRYSSAYVAQEASARDGKLGIWCGSFEQPWLWRKGHPK